MTELRYSLGGDVDLANADDLHDDLQLAVAVTDDDVLVDCTQLTFIDSAGIHVLLRVHEALAAKGRHMRLANVPDQCRRVLDLLGLSKMYRYERMQAAS